ncbi:PREDICTED: inositol-pentakisphosphate 2-kinase [Tinamus guttatus]|uniref:inositol-pentakisphosphate 2-kinase n=1 Tax=Tinamus guttatus TaxID=94827 RepID=UPI00052EEAE8|nr:PREDICTED: inositol-pentakisphosphate 2-kinase [Tinamus guttatus]
MGTRVVLQPVCEAGLGFLPKINYSAGEQNNQKGAGRWVLPFPLGEVWQELCPIAIPRLLGSASGQGAARGGSTRALFHPNAGARASVPDRENLRGGMGGIFLVPLALPPGERERRLGPQGLVSVDLSANEQVIPPLCFHLPSVEKYLNRSLPIAEHTDTLTEDACKMACIELGHRVVKMSFDPSARAGCWRCAVLRFLKFPPNQNKTSEEILHHLQNIVDFGKHVMKQFFGEKYVHHGEIVQLPLDFIRQLCLKIQPERPESRCDKDMDALSGYAMCLPNLTRLQTYRFVEHRPILCIEIKPKCGFIPFSSHVSQEIKHKVCRYCMHQHLKVANGKWKRPSKYCPLDLFSGNKQRMHFALKSLLQEAQNNLKIFKNGELIYGCKDDQDSVSDWNELARHLKPFFFPSNGLVSGPHCTRTIVKELIHVITMALLSSTEACRAGDMRTVPISQGRSYCEASAFNKELVRNGKNKLESSGLPRGCLLYKTLQAQMLDMLDIEGLYPLYNRVEQYLEEFPEERSMLQIEGPYNEAFYEKLLDLSTEDDGTVAFALTKVQQYRIAMTAKDCSIMIALSPCLRDECSEQRPVVLTSKSRFTFSVSVLDLDLKPYESIPHQYKLDGKIVNYYLKNVQAKDDPVMSSLFKENEDCTLVLHKV